MREKRNTANSSGITKIETKNICQPEKPWKIPEQYDGWKACIVEK